MRLTAGQTQNMGKSYFADKISDHRALTKEGFLLCLGVPIARTGEQLYRASELGLGAEEGYAGDEIVTVYRDAEEVFSPATIASGEGKSVTSPHPPVFLNPSNDRGYSLGHIQNVRKGEALSDGNHALIADVLIKDGQLIESVTNHILSDLSAGYDCTWVPIGDHKYAQRNIRLNHVAVVPSGRAGTEVRLLDEDPIKPERGWPVMQRTLEEVLTFMGWKKPAMDAASATATDSDTDNTVKRQEEFDKEALERAKRRNMDKQMTEDTAVKLTDALTRFADCMDKKAKDEEAEADEKKKKEVKDAEEKEASEKAKEKKDKEKEEEEAKDKKAKDAAEEKEKEEKKVESEDADLIPVETMTGEEVPKNPIPGADAALSKLRAIQPLVARSKDRKMIDAFNDAVRAIKGKSVGGGTGSYADILNGKRPEEFAAMDANDKNKAASVEFIDTAKQFHRKNPGEVKIEKRGTK